ncbi:hypothetical protein [Streptomyces sp. NPDC051016]|uniref:hypothetical protein n=1 Tax=Streptomyces sp. NPDC051016 TaxID=3365638 RepID=UPI0037BBC8AB
MNSLVLLGTAAALFIAMPWLAIALNQYCNAVNKLVARRHRPGAPCRSYRVPATAEDSGLCARCGMFDYQHQEQRDG